MELSQAALKQGELWGHAARDWSTIQEPSFAPLWRAALDAIGAGPGVRVLDAGCGSGGACLLAAGRGASVFGVDPSVNLITIARERLPAADFRIAEMENLPFPNADFHGVFAVNSLQFVSNPALAVHELGRVCRAGGRVAIGVFSDPERCEIASVFQAIAALFEHPPSGRGAFALSDLPALKALFESKAGLRLEAIQEVEGTHAYPGVETALRGVMSAGATWRAVEILGEQRVADAILPVLNRHRDSSGSVRLRNWYRCAVLLKTGE